jgi:hypothetical protein
MATETAQPGDKLGNVEKKQENGKGVMIAAIPAVIAALASITGVVIIEINHRQTVDQTNNINQTIANHTNDMNKSIATSASNANLLNQLIVQQILPYRERLLEVLGTINVEFKRTCKTTEAESNDKLVQALEQLGALSERPPYKWDKTVCRQMKDYNNYVANAYAEISTGNTSAEKKQDYDHQALDLRVRLLDAIDEFIAKLKA